MDDLDKEVWKCIEDMVYGNCGEEGVFEGIHYCCGDCNPFFWFEEEKFKNDSEKCAWYKRFEKHQREIWDLAHRKIQEVENTGICIQDYLEDYLKDSYEPKSETDMMDLGLYERWDPYKL